MTDNTSKNYPQSTSEIASIFKLDGSGAAEEQVAKTAQEPIGLPVQKQEEEPRGKSTTGIPSIDAYKEDSANGFSFSGAIKSLAPYAIVFGVAIFVYYFFFSNISFDNIFQRRPNPQVQKETLLSQLMEQQREDYSRWVQGFYFDVSDPKVTDPNTDNSGNGLSNFHKYLLNLNPKAYDTLGLGMPDSQALAQGINPLTGNSLTDDQKSVIEKYFDMEIISNRLTLAQMQQSRGLVAGSYTANQTPRGPSGGQAQPAQNGFIENLRANDPNFVDVDTSIPGRLEIPSLGINVPIIWTQDTRNFDKDLQSGVVHYPGTALPSQIGTAYISGHSSNYAWARGDYNQVFSKLGDLPNNASFKITVVQKNGKDARLHYIVTSRQEFLPTDQAQFANSSKSVAALSTCWPIGSTAKRLVVFGELSQVSKD